MPVVGPSFLSFWRKSPRPSCRLGRLPKAGSPSACFLFLASRLSKYAPYPAADCEVPCCAVDWAFVLVAPRPAPSEGVVVAGAAAVDPKSEEVPVVVAPKRLGLAVAAVAAVLPNKPPAAGCVDAAPEAVGVERFEGVKTEPPRGDGLKLLKSPPPPCAAVFAGCDACCCVLPKRLEPCGLVFVEPKRDIFPFAIQ